MTTEKDLLEPMVFDDEDLAVPITIRGVEYVLKEATGGAACKFKNAQIACTELQDGKPVRVHNIANTEPFLVSLCLFDRDGNAVPEAVIRRWPSRVQKALFERAKSISELGNDEPEETVQAAAKNVQEGTTDGSD